MLTIACLSQKGGVGKSTISRLIARTYAGGKWRVKICDFNVKQKTSVDWAAIRMTQQIKPEVAAEAFTDPKKAFSQTSYDMLVLDGRPESDPQTLELARNSLLVVIPTGVSGDDLVPQMRFAQELRMRGIDTRKILFVLNKTPESTAAIADAKGYIEQGFFTVAETSIPMKTAFVNAHNSGRTLSETDFDTLNSRADDLAKEIIERVNELTVA